MEDRVTGTITGIAFGGEGILRHENLVVFIPFTAIGDRVVCEITQRKKKYAYGKTIEILKPGPDRTTPPCPYFGTCGGCQLQHLNYAAQLHYKRQAIEDGLQRIGGLDIEEIPPVIPAETPWAYRRHITLSLRPNPNGTFSAGYIAVDKASLVQISQCQIFIPPSEPIIRQVNDFANRLRDSTAGEGRAMIFKHTSDSYLISFHFPHKPTNGAELAAEFIDTYQSWAGVILKAPKYLQTFGEIKSSLLIDGLQISYSPEAFIQNHPGQSLKIYRSILQISQGLPPGPILDLYCGIGITTLMLAKGGREAIGVESNDEAVQLARANARANQIRRAKFIKGDVKYLVKDLLKKHQPRMVVINPPRQGMEKGIVDALIQHRTEEILYISCMPSTLARDVKELCSGGYQMVLCQGYDMFPQTAHMETVIHLRRD